MAKLQQNVISLLQIVMDSGHIQTFSLRSLCNSKRINESLGRVACYSCQMIREAENSLGHADWRTGEDVTSCLHSVCVCVSVCVTRHCCVCVSVGAVADDAKTEPAQMTPFKPSRGVQRTAFTHSLHDLQEQPGHL